jgi:hypothetical protein
MSFSKRQSYLPPGASLSLSPNFFHLLRAMAGLTSFLLKAAVSILICPDPKTPSEGGVALDLVGDPAYERSGEK